MGSYVIGFDGLGRNDIGVVGGKGAHLGELSRVAGVRVPAGFCVTTDAFRRIVADAPSIDERLDRLTRVRPDDREAIRTVSAELRDAVASVTIPDDLAAAITAAVARLGADAAYAVRSSATAEDLPTASFAGQQDSYLNVMGIGRRARTHQPVLGVPVHRAGGGLPGGARHRPPAGADGRRRPAHGRGPGVGRDVHGRPRDVRPDGRRRGGHRRPGRGPGLRSGDPGLLPGARRRDHRTSIATKPFAVRASPAGGTEDGAIGPAASGPSGADRYPSRGPGAGSAGGSKRTSAAPRTSNGAWTMTTSTSSRVDRSRRCSPSR